MRSYVEICRAVAAGVSPFVFRGSNATFFFSSRRRHTISVSAFLLNRSSDLTPSVDKQASHFVHIPGLSYSGVKSPTECQQSLFESHFASRQSLSDCPVAF